MLKLAKAGAALLLGLFMAIALFVPGVFAQSTTAQHTMHPANITWQQHHTHANCGGCGGWGGWGWGGGWDWDDGWGWGW